ncbi:MAG: GAF domain-containing protein [Caldilineaceae bacterium]
MNPSHSSQTHLNYLQGNAPTPATGIVAPILAETLLELSAELLTAFDSAQLLERILALLSHLVEYETAAIHLMDGQQLITQAGKGGPAATVGHFNYHRESDFIWQYLEQEKRPYLAHDLHTEPWHPLPGFESIRSFMAVPLTAEGELMGVLTVDHSLPHCFDDNQVRLITLFANQASTALTRARLLESERQQHRFVESQLAFSYRLMQTDSSEAAIDALLEIIEAIVAFDAASVTLLTPGEAEQGYIAAVRGYSSPDDAVLQFVDMRRFELLAELMEERKPIYLAEMREANRWQPSTQPDSQEVRSILLVPLLVDTRSELLGFVTLKSYRPKAFPIAVQNNVALLCNQTAGALRTLRLLEEARHRLAEVAVLSEMSAHLNRSYDLNETLHFVLKRVVSVICQGEDPHGVHGAIILRTPGSDRLHMAVGHNLDEEEIAAFNSHAYRVHEGTFAQSIGEGEWVEMGNRETVAKAQAKQFANLSPRQLLDIPLRVGAETIGITSVDRVAQDPTTRQLLAAISDLAGSAIQKTQALEQSRQRAVELIETYDRLQALDREQDEFIQNITHDLKAPLTFIRGYAELMGEGALGKITPEQREALEVIQERTDAVNLLISNILTIKDVEARPMEEVPLHLDEIASKVARNARMAARLSGLEIQVVATSKPVIVQGDGMRMEQVFENLLSNAIKYSPEGGVIHIIVEASTETVLVSVSDEGIGIPAQEIESVWARYYRGAGMSANGSGLGLANVRRIVEAHGGRIWVHSAGRGTTFTFELPRYRGEPSAAS